MRKFERRFALGTEWDEAARDRARDYWTQRWFRLSDAGEAGISGERGNWLGNLTGYDMRRLVSHLEVSCPQPSVIEVSTSVNTAFQSLTEWNQAVFRLELVEFQSVLQGGPQLDEWRERLLRAAHAANLRWTFSMMLAGRRMPQEWLEGLAQLEATSSFVAG